VPGANGCRVERAPPMTATLTGSVSWLVKSRSACVACPFMSFTPKTSDCGKEAETETARFGVVGGSSSAWMTVTLAWAWKLGWQF
jgi:hypothetical protein